jgi:lipopolysaccharide export system protein LptC
MRVEQARYVGEDNKGQKFQIVADRAVQQSSNVPWS